MDYFSVFANCMTNAGVSFVSNMVVIAANEKEAAAKAVEHAVKSGVEIVLMAGSPGIPVAVVAIVPFRIESINRVEIATKMPTPGNPC